MGCGFLVLLGCFKTGVNAILIGCSCYKNAQAFQEQIDEGWGWGEQRQSLSLSPCGVISFSNAPKALGE